MYDGEEYVEDIYVTQECYNELVLGGNWVLDQRCSFSDTNNTKERQ